MHTVASSPAQLVVCLQIVSVWFDRIPPMRKPVAALEISVGQRELLESVARSQSGAHREGVRAKALLMASQGVANSAIAQALSVSPASVANWRTRFREGGRARLGQVRKVAVVSRRSRRRRLR